MLDSLVELLDRPHVAESVRQAVSRHVSEITRLQDGEILLRLKPGGEALGVSFAGALSVSSANRAESIRTVGWRGGLVGDASISRANNQSRTVCSGTPPSTTGTPLRVGGRGTAGP